MPNVANICTSRFKVIPVKHRPCSLHSDRVSSAGEGRREFTARAWMGLGGPQGLGWKAHGQPLCAPCPMRHAKKCHASFFVRDTDAHTGGRPWGGKGVHMTSRGQEKFPTSLGTHRCKLGRGGTTIVHPIDKTCCI